MATNQPGPSQQPQSRNSSQPNIRFWPDFKPSSTNLGSSFDLFILVPFPPCQFQQKSSQDIIALLVSFRSNSISQSPSRNGFYSKQFGRMMRCLLLLEYVIICSKFEISLIHLQCTRPKNSWQTETIWKCLFLGWELKWSGWTNRCVGRIPRGIEAVQLDLRKPLLRWLCITRFEVKAMRLNFK